MLPVVGCDSMSDLGLCCVQQRPLISCPGVIVHAASIFILDSGIRFYDSQHLVASPPPVHIGFRLLFIVRGFSASSHAESAIKTSDTTPHSVTAYYNGGYGSIPNDREWDAANIDRIDERNHDRGSGARLDRILEVLAIEGYVNIYAQWQALTRREYAT